MSSSGRIPRQALMLDTQFGDSHRRTGRPREVLIVGELAAGVSRELTGRGAVLTELGSIHQAFCVLADRSFDVVVVNPFVESRGLDFVNAIKEGETQHQLTLATIYGARGPAPFLSGITPPPAEVLEMARRRHATTPFVVLPADNSASYSVIVVPPHASFFEDGRSLPLPTAILRVDGAKLLRTTGSLA